MKVFNIEQLDWPTPTQPHILSQMVELEVTLTEIEKCFGGCMIPGENICLKNLNNQHLNNSKAWMFPPPFFSGSSVSCYLRVIKL